MKKVFVLLLTTICAISFCINGYALENESTIVHIDNVDIVFNNDSSLTIEKKQCIAEHIVNGAPNIQTFGLICNVFGHKTTTDIVITTTHCVSATVPRCLEECWEVITCSRCDYVETTRLSYAFKNCCPVD